MAIDIEKKRKLKKLLGVIANEADKEEMQQLDALKIKEIVQFFNEIEEENNNRYEKLGEHLSLILQGFDNYRQAVERHNQKSSESIGELSKALANKLDETGKKITTSYEKNKPFNAAGVYKDMINQLSAIDTSIKNKPIPVWNWPQYAAVSVRNRNFSNINPATDGLDVGDFDYVSLSQTSTVDTYTFKTGGSSGTTVATVAITFTDSTKATISTVVKTPVTIQ